MQRGEARCHICDALLPARLPNIPIGRTGGPRDARQDEPLFGVFAPMISREAYNYLNR